METMKAYTVQRYGPPEVLQLEHVNKPAPKPHEVLVRIRATSVTVADVRVRAFRVPKIYWLGARLFLGVFRPRNKRPGVEFAGVVEAIGPKVTTLKVGDQVVGMTLRNGFGAYAQYKCMPEDGLIVKMPSNLTFEEAAVLPVGALTAYNALRRAKMSDGWQVLVYGASGSVGTYSVALAKHMGGVVTGVCSGPNKALVSQQGAHKVVDYTTSELSTLPSHQFDLVWDAVGKLDPKEAKRLRKPNGKYMSVLAFDFKDQATDLTYLARLIEGSAFKPVIDRVFPFEDLPKAHAYVDLGHKKGNVAVTVS